MRETDPNKMSNTEWELWAEARITELEAENQRLREALTRLRDCDWVISLPDRMDAVRDIAKAALLGGGEK